MAKVKVSAQEVIDDIRKGLDDTEFMEKYRLSARGLESLFNKLMDAGLLTQSDLDGRMPLRENTVVVDFIPIPTCEFKWKFKAEDVVSSPAIASGMVMFGSWDGNFYAVDLETGQEKWRFRTRGAVHAKPAVSDGLVCFGSSDGYLYCLDVVSGMEKWRFKTRAQVYSAPFIAEGVVYFGSGDCHVYAIHLQTGAEKWKFKADGPVHSAPALGRGVLCFGSEDKHLYTLDTSGCGFNIRAWTQ